MTKKIGIYGTGAFATAVANKIALKYNILLYAYRPEIAFEANPKRMLKNQILENTITVVSNIEDFLQNCDIIFVIVPSMHLESAGKTLKNQIEDILSGFYNKL